MENLNQNNNVYKCESTSEESYNGQTSVYVYTFKYNEMIMGVVTVNVYLGNGVNTMQITENIASKNQENTTITDIYNGSITLYEVTAVKSEDDQTEVVQNTKNVVLTFGDLSVLGYKLVTTTDDDDQNYEYIDVGDFDLSGNVTIFTNNKILNNDDILIKTIITEDGDKTILAVLNKDIKNAVIHLSSDNGNNFTFVYLRSEEYNKTINNVYDYISIINNITDTSKLSIRLTSETFNIDEYLSLTYTQDKGYEMTILKTLPNEFKLAIYYSFMDNLTNQVQEIVYYSKTFTV